MSWITTGVSVGSAIWGGAKAAKARREQKSAEAQLENLAKNSPLRKESKSLNDYYQQALNRFTESPYQSAAYQQATRNADRTAAAGISALQDRKGAIGGVTKLSRLKGEALNNAILGGEYARSQRFSELGRATQMKKANEDELFDINTMTPYQRKLQLEQMKGAAAGERYNAGMQMLGQGLSNAAAGGMQYMDSNPGQNPFKGLFGNKSNSPTLSNASFSSDIIGMPGNKPKLPPKLKEYFQTSTPKKIF
jgi:hypothetical protein